MKRSLAKIWLGMLDGYKITLSCRGHRPSIAFVVREDRSLCCCDQEQAALLGPSWL
jgi:hypothetical protein